MIYRRREGERVRQGLGLMWKRNRDYWYAGVMLRIGNRYWCLRYRKGLGFIRGMTVIQ